MPKEAMKEIGAIAIGTAIGAAIHQTIKYSLRGMIRKSFNR